MIGAVKKQRLKKQSGVKWQENYWAEAACWGLIKNKDDTWKNSRDSLNNFEVGQERDG